jgi:hypothetical protein
MRSRHEDENHQCGRCVIIFRAVGSRRDERHAEVKEESLRCPLRLGGRFSSWRKEAMMVVEEGRVEKVLCTHIY